MLNRLMKERGDLLLLEIRLLRRTGSVAGHDVSHESMMVNVAAWISEFQGYHILL